MGRVDRTIFSRRDEVWMQAGKCVTATAVALVALGLLLRYLPRNCHIPQVLSSACFGGGSILFTMGAPTWFMYYLAKRQATQKDDKQEATKPEPPKKPADLRKVQQKWGNQSSKNSFRDQTWQHLGKLTNKDIDESAHSFAFDTKKGFQGQCQEGRYRTIYYTKENKSYRLIFIAEKAESKTFSATLYIDGKKSTTYSDPFHGWFYHVKSHIKEWGQAWK